VANRDAPVDRNVLLFRALIADMTPPSLAYCSAKPNRQFRLTYPLNTASRKEVSNPQNGGWDGEMNWCVGTAWRMFCSIYKKYRCRRLWSSDELHVDGRKFLGKGSERLRSQLEESITSLPHRLLSGRGAVYCGLRLERQ